MMRYIDHTEAGQLLARRLMGLRIENPVVLAIPPGGARIAREIAREMKAPMDVLPVREISIPGRNRCSIGAVVDGGFYPDESACRREGVTREYAGILAAAEQCEEERWERSVRQNRAPVELEGCSAIIANDVALDRERLQAVRAALRERKVRHVIQVSVFACAGERRSDPSVLLVTLFSPEESRSVMLVNAGFQQTTEEEIAELLGRSRPWSPDSRPAYPAEMARPG